MAKRVDSQASLSSLPPITSDAHRWRVAEASYGGSPLLIRLNAGATPWVGHAALPIRLGFAIPLNRPNEGGLPDPAENEELNEVEDVIRREVEAKATGMHVLVLTTGMMREYVFYISPGADLAAIHKAAQQAVSTHEVQCKAVMDSEWDVYHQIVGTA